jgi:hypothetical protein
MLEQKNQAMEAGRENFLLEKQAAAREMIV